jgi:hypothetical protein
MTQPKLRSGAFYGSYRDYPKSRGQLGGIRGIRKMIRGFKREDAMARAAVVLHARTKAHRLKRCTCG